MTNSNMNNNNNQEWSCATCTFINKPLFLSCEMCGQNRPSQGPIPPRRQASMEMDTSCGSNGTGTGTGTSTTSSSVTPPPPCRTTNSSSSSRGGGGDRAPRQVQRHNSTVDIMGTLILEDDPNDYERQDGKKPGEVEQEEAEAASIGISSQVDSSVHVLSIVSEEDEDVLSHELRSRRREDDPTMDESHERHNTYHNERDYGRYQSERYQSPRDRDYQRQHDRYHQHDSRNSERYYNERERDYDRYQQYQQGQQDDHRRRQRGDYDDYDRYAESDRRGGSARGESRRRDMGGYGHTHSHMRRMPAYDQEPRMMHPRPAPGVRKPPNHSNSSSNHTAPTDMMGNSSYSNGIGFEEDSFQDDGASVRSRQSTVSHRRQHHQPQSRHHMGSSSLPHNIRASRTSSASSTCSSVSSRGYYSRRGSPEAVGGHSRRSSGGNNGMLMADTSGNSHYSSFSSFDGNGSITDMNQNNCHSSRGTRTTVTRRPSTSSVMSAPVMSARNVANSEAAGHPHMTSLRRDTSTTSYVSHGPGSGELIESVLPSVAPPDLPAIDSPANVNSMAVFVKDREQDERRASFSSQQQQHQQGRSTNSNSSRRKSRAAMLDNLTKGGAAALTSSRSLAPQAAPSTRRLLPQISMRRRNNNAAAASSASLAGTSQHGDDDNNSTSHQFVYGVPPPPHPELLNEEALDSPNTRKERLRQKKPRGLVRGMMASMRLVSTGSKN